MIEIVSCTQRSWDDFWKSSALGLSLTRIGEDTRVSGSIVSSNQQGLPLVYNQRIDAENGIEILVFIHDDVWLDDYFFFDRIVEGLSCFDIIGVAGVTTGCLSSRVGPSSPDISRRVEMEE